MIVDNVSILLEQGPVIKIKTLLCIEAFFNHVEVQYSNNDQLKPVESLGA